MEREKIEALKQAPMSEVTANIAMILEALKDDTLQHTALQLLNQIPTESTPYIEEGLLSQDDELKQVLLEKVVPKLPFYSKIVVANAVEHIAMASGDLQQLAKDALKSFEP
ncbi:hypothetical protein AAGS61_11605 [Lysinibacillus sp. KU-BSD001]|uniref:hypothetical protein n=1 Tax=Lysinibacillus sp. KU-BSD001 TaxID=3141328 RepID=UPI0036E75CA1